MKTIACRQGRKEICGVQLNKNMFTSAEIWQTALVEIKSNFNEFLQQTCDLIMVYTAMPKLFLKTLCSNSHRC